MAAELAAEVGSGASELESGKGVPNIASTGFDAGPTMMDLMSEMRSMRLSLDTKFIAMQGQLGDLKSELATLKAEMVTKEIFQSLEVRVCKLEAEGAPNVEVSWLQSQVGRLDPANKSLCLRGFKEDDPRARTKRIESILESVGAKGELVHVEHIWKGPPGQRSVSEMSTVELSSRQAREEALKKLTQDNSKLDGASGVLKVARAKTSTQLKRNSCLTRAADILKKDGRNNGKTVEICWKVDGSKDRQVQVAGQVAFSQTSSDLAGRFLAPFEALTF